MRRREQEDRTERPPLATSTRDLDDLARCLATWWSARTPGASDVEVRDVSTPGATGVANETVLFDLHWREAGRDRHRDCVARIAASDVLFLDSDIGEHCRVVDAIAGHSAVPVPKIYALELDASIIGAPFYVMERIAGDIPTDEPSYNEAGWLADAAEEQREQAWRSAVETLAELHRVDPAPLAFLRGRHPGATGLERDLAYWQEAATWAADGHDLPVLTTTASWLRARLPAGHPTGFAWGDARYANMIFDDFTCAAVLDWDMASLAGAEADLGWWVLFEHVESTARGLAPLAGLGSSADTIALWEKTIGRSARHLDWFVVFAAYRMCIAVTRAATMLTARGLLPAGSQMLTNNIGTQYLVSMLDLPPAGEQLVSWPGL
jgi:aminoglycoside phosphotransferase (APT) family kinase protein